MPLCLTLFPFDFIIIIIILIWVPETDYKNVHSIDWAISPAPESVSIECTSLKHLQREDMGILVSS